jgi:hypothetical protein
MLMVHKTAIALLAVTAIGLASPTMALARGGGGGGGHGGGMGGGGGFHGGGGFGGGGFHGGGIGGGFRGGNMAGGFHGGSSFGGFRGGGFHDRGFHGRGFGSRFAFGTGLGYGAYDPYYYDDYSDGYGYPYASGDSYAESDGCYLVQRRVHTAHGWRRQPVQVCG